MIIIVTRKTPIHPSRPSWDIPPSLFWQHLVQSSQSHLSVVFLFLCWWFCCCWWYDIFQDRDCVSLSHPCVLDGLHRAGAQFVKWRNKVERTLGLGGMSDPCNVLAEEARKRASPTIFIHSFPSHCSNSKGGRAKWSLSGLLPWPVPPGALDRCQAEAPDPPPTDYFSWPSSPAGITENWLPLKLCCSHWLI